MVGRQLADERLTRDRVAAAAARIVSIRGRAEAGEELPVADVSWMADYALRLAGASHEMLKAVRRWSDPTFKKRVDLERALRDEDAE